MLDHFNDLMLQPFAYVVEFFVVHIFRRSCLSSLLTQGVKLCLANEKRCKGRCINLNLRTSPVIGPNQLCTLLHVVVQMSIVQTIELELNNVSRSQQLRLLQCLQISIYKAKSTHCIITFIPIQYYLCCLFVGAVL